MPPAPECEMSRTIAFTAASSSGSRVILTMAAIAILSSPDRRDEHQLVAVTQRRLRRHVGAVHRRRAARQHTRQRRMALGQQRAHRRDIRSRRQIDLLALASARRLAHGGEVAQPHPHRAPLSIPVETRDHYLGRHTYPGHAAHIGIPPRYVSSLYGTRTLFRYTPLPP